MIDHLLGRPSVKSRRLQVLAVIAFWSAYLFRGNKHGPPVFRFFSRLLSKRVTAWQTVIITMIYLYAARNFSTLVGLASPDPMSNMYDATYFRATWVLTALDAGFWTAMKIRYKWLRDLASIVFSVFYMVAAEKADEKVRKVRGNITVEHLRVSWNKGNSSPYLRFLQGMVRPRFTRWPPRAIRIPRPSTSDYKEPVSGWLYYDGPISDLQYHNRIVLDIPGGGFVAMDPRCNDDKLNSWAAKTGLPVLSLDYKKAPEYPYPYALNECFDVYSTIIKSKGRCIGMSGREVPHVVVTGDSAGGTLATAMTLMIVESTLPSSRRVPGQPELPVPDGLVIFYPALDMNIGSWMSDEQMALIKDRRMRGTNKPIIDRKTKQYNELAGTPGQSDDEDDVPPSGTGSASALKTRSSLESGGVDITGTDGKPLTRSESVTGPAPEYAHPGPSTWSHQQDTSSSSPYSYHPSQDNTTPSHQRQQSSSTASNPSSSSTKPPTASHSTSHHPEPMRTRLATSSMISYFNDRVLTPEMMRAMIILYVGPHNRPDFSRDYLLSPILAPDSLLARFPKTYFLTGERDPLVDDTVIFAGRLRRVKAAQMASGGERLEYRDTDFAEAVDKSGFDERDVAEVALIPGISHGFLQFPAVYPLAWGLIGRIAVWIEDCFERVEEREREGRRRRVGVRGGRGRGRWRGRGSVVAVDGEVMEKGEAGGGPGSDVGAAGGNRSRRGTVVEVKINGVEVVANGDDGSDDTVTGERRDGKGKKNQQQQQQQQYVRRESASGDEDRPLEMMRMTRKPSLKSCSSDDIKTERRQSDVLNGVEGRENGNAADNDDDDDDNIEEDDKDEEGEDEEPYPNPVNGASSSGGSSTAERQRSGMVVSDKSNKQSKRKGGLRGRANTKRDKTLSLVKLASSDDLLGRRMHGLAGGLTGLPASPE